MSAPVQSSSSGTHALRQLVEKLEAIHEHPRFKAVWETAHFRLGPYDGPTYTQELADAKAALSVDAPHRESAKQELADQAQALDMGYDGGAQAATPTPDPKAPWRCVVCGSDVAKCTCALAQGVRKLDWQEVGTDRGDGSRDITGWEADSGFGPWYVVDMYFAGDAYGWTVDYDGVKIGDCDEPEKAKETAQGDFERRALSVSSTEGNSRG